MSKVRKTSADILADIARIKPNVELSRPKLSNALAIFKDLGRISHVDNDNSGKGRAKKVYEMDEDFYKTVFLD